MKKNIIFAVFLLFLSCSTREQKDIQTEIIQLNPKEEDKIEKMSNIFEISRYLPLETLDDELIGGIGKIIATFDKYIIFDNVAMKVFIFNKETGDLIKIIDAMGQGPSEYTEISDISYQKKNDEILILAPQKILIYTSAGVFKKEEKVNVFASNISVNSLGEVVLYANYTENSSIEGNPIKDNLLVLNDKYSIEKRYMPFNGMVNSFVRINPLFGLGENFLYYEKMEDNLYKFTDNDSLKVRYSIDYGNTNHKIAQEILNTLEKDKSMDPYKSLELERRKGYYTLHNLIDLKSNLLLLYSGKNYFHYAFYNKTKKIVTQYSKGYGNGAPIPFENDFDDSPYYIFVGGDDDILLSYTNPDDLIDSAEGNNEPLEAIRPKLKSDGNFVIVEFKLKN